MRVSLPIHLRNVPLTVVAGVARPRTLWRSPDLDTRGNNVVNAFMTLDIVSDTLVGVGLGLSFELVQSYGSHGAVAATVAFPGEYALGVPLGAARLPALVSDQAMGTQAYVRLVSVNEAGVARTMVAHIDGVIVAGTPTERAAGRR